MTKKTTGFVKVKGRLCEYSFEPVSLIKKNLNYSSLNALLPTLYNIIR